MEIKDLLLAGICLGMVTCQAHADQSLTLKKIKETGIITLGYRDASIPFSYLDDKQRPIGYSMDLCLRIAKAVQANLKLRSLQIKTVPATSSTRIPLIKNSTIDLECGTTTNTAERQRHVSFVVTTFVASTRILSKRATPRRTLNDLRGRTVVSTAGTTSIKQLVELNVAENLQLTILAGKEHSDSFSMLTTDRAAAYLMDDVLLYAQVASSGNPTAYLISDESLSVEPYGIAIRKNDPGFKKVADGAIIALFKSGEIHAIYNRWFMSPIPPMNINLQLPMGPALKKAIANPTDSGNPGQYR